METTLAAELTRLRTLKRVSLRDVEKEIKISNAYLSQLERGEATKPSPHWLHKLSVYYGVPYETLMALAGYLETTSIGAESGRGMTSLELALMSAKLNDEEQAEVLDFVQYLTSKRR